METPNKLIKYHQLALPKKRVKLISIWERIVGKETGEVIFSFSILTINADGHEVMMHFHRTMDEKHSIVVLKNAEYQHWLHSNHNKARQLLNLATPRFLKSEAVPRRTT